MTFDDQGYEWHEVTAAPYSEMRTFIRGRKLEPAVRQWFIQTPDGVRCGWVDGEGQEHWVRPEMNAPATWRRLYVEQS